MTSATPLVKHIERVVLVRLYNFDLPDADVLQREDARAPRDDVPRQRRVLEVLNKAVEVLRHDLRRHRLDHDVPDLLLQLLRVARLLGLALLPRRHRDAEHPDHVPVRSLDVPARISERRPLLDQRPALVVRKLHPVEDHQAVALVDVLAPRPDVVVHVLHALRQVHKTLLNVVALAAIAHNLCPGRLVDLDPPDVVVLEGLRRLDVVPFILRGGRNDLALGALRLPCCIHPVLVDGHVSFYMWLPRGFTLWFGL